MNLSEQQIHYPFGDALPAPGESMEVAPGVRWIRMALPFALDHINLWLLADEMDGVKGWTAVDCCISHDASKAQWERIFATQLDGLPILRVLVTHMHPDHIGLAGWLCERWSTPERACPLWISATDYYVAKIGSQSATGFGGEGAARFFASHGLTDEGALQKVRERKNYYSNMVPNVPPGFHRISDADTVRIGGRGWKCISGHGHAPEHIALYCDELRVLIAGDMVLPRISTNVSVYEAEPEADSLQLFLNSIDKFKPLPADTLTLPSHGKPFGRCEQGSPGGLHTRIEQLHAHHRERLDELLVACAESPKSAHDVLPLLFKRPLDLHQTTFAMGESIAHMHLLWLSGKVKRERDADGVWRFGAA
ncbi:MAG: MBL fold metallo-hydrolase [Burkholderiales bacterium]